jgi:hypothetical protein
MPPAVWFDANLGRVVGGGLERALTDHSSVDTHSGVNEKDRLALFMLRNRQ